MTTMKRLLSGAPVVLGSLLISSCLTPDPYGPYDRPYSGPQGPGAQDFGPYGNPNGPRPPQNDPYENPEPSYGQQGIQDPNYGGQPPVNPPTRVDPPKYPMAEKTKNPNEVLSPYAPYNVIDVSGFRSGQLAKDPSNKTENEKTSEG